MCLYSNDSPSLQLTGSISVDNYELSENQMKTTGQKQ